MGRWCLTCRHENVSEIDRLLLRGVPLRDIAAQFGPSPAALCRHKAHISAALTKAHEASEVARADDLLAQVESLRLKAMRILERAELAEEMSRTAKDADRSRRTSLGAIKEIRGTLELLARLLGELKDGGTTVNVLISPQWVTLRTVILAAVEPYPAARQAIIEAVGHESGE